MASRTEVSTDFLILGAGMSGLMAASTLQGSSRRVVVLDKGTSVGGRMATRRIGPGRADHGAQFFTVRTDEFGKWVERWQKAGLVYMWARGGRKAVCDLHPKWVNLALPYGAA